jgi:serine/threonine protein kinase
MPGLTSSAELIEIVRKNRLADEARLGPFLAQGRLPTDTRRLVSALVAAGALTDFQARCLLAGKHRALVLGSYRVLSQLGRGGMGVVYLAEHLDLQRKVAVKVLSGRSIEQGVAEERFYREARSAAALDHPNIVRIYDIARAGRTPYIVMEYVEGQTPRALVEARGPLPFARAADYVAQAARGLQHAHERGLVHRDIKPDNLILDKAGTVKVLDMGLARPATGADNLTEKFEPNAILGSADFLAPEQALGGGVDIRADIYSLGATFFALVTGQAPFQGSTAQKLTQHQLREAPSLSLLQPDVPARLAKVVAKMLAKQPADRYATPAEVRAALTPFLRPAAANTSVVTATGADRPASRPPRAPGRRAEKTDRGRPPAPGSGRARARAKWRLPAAAGAVVLLAGGALWWSLSGDKAAPPGRPPAHTEPGPPRPWQAALTGRGAFRPLPLDEAATAVSTRPMFYGEGHPLLPNPEVGERLIFSKWGPITFDRVPFHLVDPQGKRVPNVIVLRGGPRGALARTMPTAVGVRCDGPARAIHLLSGVSGWGHPADQTELVSLIVRLRYADGQAEEHPLRNGVHFADYIRRVDVPGSRFAFALEQGCQVRYLVVYPHRRISIREVRFVKGPDDTAPVVLAVTLERP